jgi:glycosyltransferase involved in cell wall biosynthesis
MVHFHNVSLVGGAGLLRLAPNAVRIMSAHEHWLICQMHLLWKYERKACDGASCVRCSLRSARPPQFWRLTGAINRGLRKLDALVFPSHHALEEHRRRGIGVPMVRLPYFLPDDWAEGLEDEEPEPTERPYLAAAGRFVRMKGFQHVISMMRYLPEADLRIAGTGPFENELRRYAADLPNVRFEGLLGGAALARLFHGARAVVVPSLFPETFGYVVLEAFSVRTPVIVNRRGGALEETGVRSGGGLGYETDAELLLAMRRLVHDDALRAELSHRGFKARTGEWSERAHLDRYFDLIRSIQSGRLNSNAGKHGPHRGGQGEARSRLITLQVGNAV